MEESFRGKMAELRSVCLRDIEIQQQKLEASFSSFSQSLQSVKSKSAEGAENQVQLGKLKARLREAEDQLVKALAAKTRKEAKQMAVMDSISVMKDKVEELNRTLQDQRRRKDEYARIIYQQTEALSVSEEKIKQDTRSRNEVEEACAWYNEVLGLQIEGGHGVKFTFTNINRRCPSEEYSFTVRHADDVYTLLDCNPQLNDIKELVHELNKTNGLFKFVRIMRAKFQHASAPSGPTPLPCLTSPCQDATELSMAAPSSLVSPDSRSQTPEPLKEQFGDNLTFDELPVQILDSKEKTLGNKVVKLVKVLLHNHKIEEATWETESSMREKYPHLFV